MSLADEVLAEHTKASLGDYCSVCHDQWPCEPVRLALSLHAPEQLESVRRCTESRCVDSMRCSTPERNATRLSPTTPTALMRVSMYSQPSERMEQGEADVCNAPSLAAALAECLADALEALP